MQIISGISLTAYWISNVIIDLAKTYLSVGIMILLIIAFDLVQEGIVAVLLLYPLATVPFTYFFSLFFSKDDVAQVTREAILKQIGTRGTRGDITQNPVMQESEQLAMQSDFGSKIRSLKQDQQAKLFSYLDKVKSSFGGDDLSEANFDAPYKFAGLLALSVDNATTRLTL